MKTNILILLGDKLWPSFKLGRKKKAFKKKLIISCIRSYFFNLKQWKYQPLVTLFSLENKYFITNQYRFVLFWLEQQFLLVLIYTWQSDKLRRPLFLFSAKHAYVALNHDFLWREMMHSNYCKNSDTRAGLLCSVMSLLTVISTDIDFYSSDLMQHFH